jgi:hypothetical protein
MANESAHRDHARDDGDGAGKTAGYGGGWKHRLDARNFGRTVGARIAPTVLRKAQVSWYRGPSPPSGSVSRPPLAVIAPHWTQLEAVTWTSTVAAPLSSWSSGIS